MKKARMDLEQKKSGVEINRPVGDGSRQLSNPGLALGILLASLLWFWWQSDLRAAREEIPYSEFLRYLEQDQLEKVLVEDNFIQGTLKLQDERTGKPRIVVTIPLANAELAGLLEQH
jgi:cell division protease FtsH